VAKRRILETDTPTSADRLGWGFCTVIYPRRSHLTNRQREELWDSECAKATAQGRGEHPICNLCNEPVTVPGDRWHESHNPYLPRAIGGSSDGIAHERCNLHHGHKIATPQVAKAKRVRQKFIGAFRSSRPLPGGRDDPRKKTMDGLVDRATGEPWRGWR
jgi:hypothetical protein